MKKHLAWRVFDALLSAGMVVATIHWGNYWLAAGVFAFGFWNYFDGLCEQAAKVEKLEKVGENDGFDKSGTAALTTDRHHISV